jgi:transcriptional regulator with XRE-family HTH domain
MTVGKNLRRLRRERGLGQEELARLARSSQQTISDLETGRRPGAQTRTLEKLARALHVPVTEFFAGARPPRGPRPPKAPDIDQPIQVYDERFAATDAESASALADRVDAQFGAVQEHIKALKAAGVPDTDFKLRRARDRFEEAKRRLRATRARAETLGINADFGRDLPVYDTVAEYVGAALEVDADHGAEEARSRAHPESA